MKYTVALIVCFFASIEAFPAFPGFPEYPEFQPVAPEFPRFPGSEDFFGSPVQPDDILSDLRNCLVNKIANNVTLLSNFIAALNSANLSQYVISVNDSQTVNFTSLFQNYFTTLPALSSYFYTYILTIYTNLAPDFNATLAVIQQLNTNKTVLKEFIGHLFIQDMFNYVSSSQGNFVVDFTLIQANEQYSSVLDRFIAEKVADLKKPDYPPLDYEDDNDDDDDD